MVEIITLVVVVIIVGIIITTIRLILKCLYEKYKLLY